MTSIERTAYPRFKRLITARELHVFFTPSDEERAWAEEATDSDEHQLRGRRSNGRKNNGYR
ncbi:DUF4158 domain-containing protein [Streptomyces wedmorensis]